jgi:vacuolar-type H+-ATPase subunit H
MSDGKKDLLKIMARINDLRTQALVARERIKESADDVFADQQTNIEMLRTKAAKGDEKAQAAYLALLRGRVRLHEIH